MDDTISIKELKKRIKKFRDERDWEQFHDPKNLAEAISIEAAELQELFLWKNVDEINNKIKNEPEYRKKIEYELSDVITFALNLANTLDVDVARTITEKIEINNKKYPVDKARGVSTKYNKL